MSVNICIYAILKKYHVEHLGNQNEKMIIRNLAKLIYLNEGRIESSSNPELNCGHVVNSD